jgi:hypothetical protein
MSIISQISNAHFYATEFSSSASASGEQISAQPPKALTGIENSHFSLGQFVGAAAGSIDLNQVANQSDVDKLQEADALVADAYGLVGGRSASPLDQFRARFEMAEASAIRQSVAKDLEARYPDDGIGVGGRLYAEQIQQADAEEQQGFKLMQSSNPADISNGSTDLLAGSGFFNRLENNLRG